jgi:hypothetical protein
MQWTLLIVGFTAIYFICASVTTFDIRLTRARLDGSLPPDQPMLPSWVGAFVYAQFAGWFVLLELEIRLNFTRRKIRLRDAASGTWDYWEYPDVSIQATAPVPKELTERKGGITWMKIN